MLLNSSKTTYCMLEDISTKSVDERLSVSSVTVQLFVELLEKEYLNENISLRAVTKFVQSNNITNNLSAELIKGEKDYVARCNEFPYIYGQGGDQDKALINLKQGIAEELNISIDKISLNRVVVLTK